MTNPSVTKQRTAGIVPWLMLAIALGGFVYAGLGLFGLSEAQIPGDWKSVPGQVLNSHVEQTQMVKSDGSTIATFQPVISYRYEVDGVFLIGSQLSRYHPQRTLRGVAETELEDLSQGTNVTVYYNPANPKQAVLRKGDTIGPIQAISAGLMIGLTCFAIFFISFRKRWQPVVAIPEKLAN